MIGSVVAALLALGSVIPVGGSGGRFTLMLAPGHRQLEIGHVGIPEIVGVLNLPFQKDALGRSANLGISLFQPGNSVSWTIPFMFRRYIGQGNECQRYEGVGYNFAGSITPVAPNNSMGRKLDVFGGRFLEVADSEINISDILCHAHAMHVAERNGLVRDVNIWPQLALHSFPSDTVILAGGRCGSGSAGGPQMGGIRIFARYGERSFCFLRLSLGKSERPEIKPQSDRQTRHSEGAQPELMPSPIGGFFGGLRSMPLGAKIGFILPLWIAAWGLIFGSAFIDSRCRRLAQLGFGVMVALVGFWLVYWTK